MATNIDFELEYLNFILSLAEANGDKNRIEKIKKEIATVQAKKQKLNNVHNIIIKKDRSVCLRRELC